MGGICSFIWVRVQFWGGISTTRDIWGPPQKFMGFLGVGFGVFWGTEPEFGVDSGGVLGVIWGVLGDFREFLGFFRRVLGVAWSALGDSRVFFGVSDVFF